MSTPVAAPLGVGSADTEAPGLQAGDRSPATTKRRRRRLAVIAVGLLALLLALVALTAGRSTGGTLDPRSAGPDGARALATLLRARGVTVDRSAAGGLDRTVFVPFPQSLDRSALDQLMASGADLVLVDPGPLESVPLDAGPPLQVRTRSPGCSLDAAEIAGPARLGGTRYRTSNTAISCYGGSLLVMPEGNTAGGGRFTVLGSADFMTNARLDQQGDAALALGLLSGHPQLTWYTARRSASGASLSSLLPKAIPWALLQIGIALLVIGFWRGRRLGPVVTEPLPVVVRAAETVLGRARLYAAARARDTAATALREGSRTRLAALVHLDPHAPPAALVAAVAARVGEETESVAALLYGGSIGDGYVAATGGKADTVANGDAALVRLADELDRLEHKARETTSR